MATLHGALWSVLIVELVAAATGVFKGDQPQASVGMEWIIIVGIVLFAISKLNGKKTSEPTRPELATSRGLTVDDPDFTSALAAWRKQIVIQFGSQWVPASRAERIAALHPIPTWKGSPWANPIGKSSTADLIKIEIKKNNDFVLNNQRTVNRSFFDSVEKKPLTPEQVHACVCMDDNVMVVAAAGSGKTSTMVAKAGYVLSQNLAKANQILMLAFNSAAANELGERVAERLKNVPGIEDISSQTFHAFGLTVIGAATG
jgi:DNA helicase-4